MSIFAFIGIVLLVSYTKTTDAIQLAYTTSNFVYPLKSNLFFNQTDGEAVRFIAMQPSLPDPPSWLHVIQPESAGPAYLYGTPTGAGGNVNLQIVAVKESSQQASVQNLNIEVKPKPDEEVAKYFVELRIRNFNIDEILVGDHLRTLLRKMSRMWNRYRNMRVYITQVKSLVDVGERVPVPTAPGAKDIKEGVLVQFGSPEDFSMALKGAEMEVVTGCALNGDKPPQLRLRDRFTPDYVVDWCKLRLVVPSMINGPTTNSPGSRGAIALTGDGHSDGLDDDALGDIPRREFFLEFMLMVVLPLAFAFLLFLLLSCIMFCGREGIEKRNRKTPERQLYQFYSIRRATNNLRFMSTRRDILPSGRQNDAPYTSTPMSTLNRSTAPQSEAGEQDPKAPPPYRLPPSYHEDGTMPVEGRRTRGSSTDHYDDDCVSDNQQLVHHTPSTSRIEA